MVVAHLIVSHGTFTKIKLIRIDRNLFFSKIEFKYICLDTIKTNN